jgi:hypothetical protein
MSKSRPRVKIRIPKAAVEPAPPIDHKGPRTEDIPENNCGNCRFAHQMGPRPPHMNLYCHRYPPFEDGTFPRAGVTLWCGEYQPRIRLDEPLDRLKKQIEEEVQS